jgi:hypothetical protein
MSRRRDSRDDSPDTLGFLVSAVLHQSVRAATPPSRVWEQIERQVRQSIEAEQARLQAIPGRRPAPGSLVCVDECYFSAGGVLPIL